MCVGCCVCVCVSVCAYVLMCVVRLWRVCCARDVCVLTWFVVCDVWTVIRDV